MAQKLVLILAAAFMGVPAYGMDSHNLSNEQPSARNAATNNSQALLDETLRNYIETHQPIEDILDIIARGADVNVPNDEGQTPLLLTSNVAIGKILLDHRANVNAPDLGGRTPLHEAVMDFNEAFEYPTLLIDNRANLSARDDIGWTPLHCAANSQNSGLCKLLIQRNGDVNAMDDAGHTPLLQSVTDNGLNVCTVLLENGAHVDTSDGKDDTPLHLASRYRGTAEIATLLVEKSANVNATNKVSKTPLHNLIVRIIKDPTILRDARSSAQTLMLLLKNRAHAFIIPTISDTGETRKKRIFTALCTLNRVAKPLRLPWDICYQILASNKELRCDLLYYLLPRIQRNADNNTLPLTLKTIPLQFHEFFTGVIYQYTMAHLKKALGILKFKDISSIEKRVGKMMYYGIAHQLGAHLKVTPDPEQSLFAV